MNFDEQAPDLVSQKIINWINLVLLNHSLTLNFETLGPVKNLYIRSFRINDLKVFLDDLYWNFGLIGIRDDNSCSTASPNFCYYFISSKSIFRFFAMQKLVTIPKPLLVVSDAIPPYSVRKDFVFVDVGNKVLRHQGEIFYFKYVSLFEILSKILFCSQSSQKRLIK